MMIDNPYQETSNPYTEEESLHVEQQQKINSFFSKLKYYFIQVWPAIYKTLNGILYWIMKTIKSSVSYAIQQIRFGG